MNDSFSLEEKSNRELWDSRISDHMKSWYDIDNLPFIEVMIRKIKPAPSMGSWLSGSHSPPSFPYRYFDQDAKWHDPTFSERIAASFREKYDSLRGTMTPNEVFYEIQTWVGGSARGTAEHEMAVLSVMAYYFESCDIFEEPRS